MDITGLLIDRELEQVKRERRVQQPQPQVAEIPNGTAIAQMTARAIPEMKADQKLLQAARAANEKFRAVEAQRAALQAANAVVEDVL